MKLQRAISDLHGFTMTNLAAIVAIIALAGGCYFSHFSQEKTRAQSLSCYSNLRQAGLAFRVWSDDNNGYPMSVYTKNRGSLEFAANGNAFRHFQCVSNELIDPKLLICPADIRSWAASFKVLNNDNVSYFVSVSADETKPQMFLTGDRNLAINGSPARTGLVAVKSTDEMSWTPQEIHQGHGNVGLADGSVQQYTSSGLQRALTHTGTNVNRLAIP